MTKLSSRGNESGQKKLAHYCFFTLLTRLTRDSYAEEGAKLTKTEEKILLSKFNVIFEFGTDCRNLHFVFA